MIIDYAFKKENVDISYIDKEGNIQIYKHFLFDENSTEFSIGYYKFVECDNEFDENILPNLKSFYNNKIKIESAKYFTGHNINHFLHNDLKRLKPDIYNELSELRIPNIYSIDIETEINDEFGYSTPEKAENKILSISITDINLKTIFFKLKTPTKDGSIEKEITPTDKGYIDNLLKNIFENQQTCEFDWDIYYFDSEKEMLESFLLATLNYLHVMIGWNVIGYDINYIYNRCQKLNIKYSKASPVNSTYKKRIEIRAGEHQDIILPKHRVVIDYMTLFKESLTYSNLGSYSLNYISNLILKLSKVNYDGNLRKLYMEDRPKFIAYGLVDTILVMLLHKNTDLLTTEFFQSYYTGVPVTKLTQTSISEALVYKELIKENIFLLETEYSKNNVRPYKGGYVKTPTNKIVEGVIGYDFSSLYPNCMITMGLSFESKVDEIKVDEFGKPLTEKDNKIWLKWKKQNCCLSPEGRIYKIDKDYLYTRIEKGLLNERDGIKKYMSDIYLKLIPEIEKRIENF